MCTQVEMDLIRQEAGMWMQRGKSFTSVDIANSLKQRKQWIRNRDVANFLRSTAVGMALQYSLTPYKMSVINVQLPNGKWTEASLYHPENIDPDDYKNIKQKALSPDEAEDDNPFPQTETAGASFKVNITPTQDKEKTVGIKDLGSLEKDWAVGLAPISREIVLNLEYVEHLSIYVNK